MESKEGPATFSVVTESAVLLQSPAGNYSLDSPVQVKQIYADWDANLNLRLTLIPPGAEHTITKFERHRAPKINIDVRIDQDSVDPEECCPHFYSLDAAAYIQGVSISVADDSTVSVTLRTAAAGEPQSR